MNDHDLEQLIRRRLTDLAGDSPTAQFPTQRASDVRRRGVVRLAGAGLVMASAVVGGIVLTIGSDDSESTTSAVCPNELQYQGEWYAAVGVKRMPIEGERLSARATLPRCGDGAEPARQISAYSVPSASPHSAIIAEGILWTNTSLVRPPTPVVAARKPVACQVATDTVVSGFVTDIRTSAEPRFDGDVRGPFTLELRTEDPAITGSGYQWVTLRANGDAANAPSPSLVAAVLYDGKPAVVSLGCDSKNFVVRDITLAD